MFLRELFEAPGKQASFALGRLNPATTGHEILVDQIKAQPGDSFLFLTDRLPKLPKDPLTAQDKLDWARKSFDGISIGLAKTVLIAADRLYKMGYTDVIYLEGIDPEKPFPLSKLIKDYNGVKKDLHDYNFNSIEVVQLPRDASAADASGMSGTKMRQLVADNNLEKFKQDAVTQKAQPYAEEMFKKLQGIMGVDSIEEKVSNEVAAPKTIKVMKPTNPPKPPDATIPRSRDGYTAKNGTTYVQDKYDEKLMHVTNGGGTYTFDGSRMIKWQTPRIQGLKFIYDYVQNKIYLDSKNEVDIDDGSVNIDQLAAYDMKGNLIKDSGSIGVGAGGFSVKQDKSGVSVKNSMFDPFNDVTIVLKSNPDKVKKYGKEKLQKSIDKYLGYLKQSQMGRPMPNMDHEGRLKQLMAVADVKFMKNGQSIPASQAIKGAKEWWASLDKTNQDRNAKIAKQRAP